VRLVPSNRCRMARLAKPILRAPNIAVPAGVRSSSVWLPSLVPGEHMLTVDGTATCARKQAISTIATTQALRRGRVKRSPTGILGGPCSCGLGLEPNAGGILSPAALPYAGANAPLMLSELTTSTDRSVLASSPGALAHAGDDDLGGIASAARHALPTGDG
jgi:hypothetical protein